MTAEHIRALDGISFNWGTKGTDLASIWSVQFQQLCEFKLQFGHYFVPIKYSDNPKLGRWVSKQRKNYRLYQEGHPSPMTTDHIRALDSFEFKWKLNDLSWNERFEQLREFTAHFGHCLVPTKYADNLKLVHWVSRQRSNYRLYQEGTPSPMTAERIRELDSVEFQWELNDQLHEYKVQSKCGFHTDGKPSHIATERIRKQVRD
jgi:hypothetical protein